METSNSVLTNFWKNVLKAFIQNKLGINLEQDFSPKYNYNKDLFYLPEEILRTFPNKFENYNNKNEEDIGEKLKDEIKIKHGEVKFSINFFRALSDDIKAITGKEITVKDLVGYHLNAYSGRVIADKLQFKGNDDEIFRAYWTKREIEEVVNKKARITDWGKILAWLFGISLLGVLLYFFLLNPTKENNQIKTQNTELIEKGNKIHQLDSTIKAFKNDTYSPLFGFDEKRINKISDILNGNWYSYNDSNLLKEGDKTPFPYDKIKWNFDGKGEYINIQRIYSSDKNETIMTYMMGRAEEFDNFIYLHLNVFSKDKKTLIGKRQFICKQFKLNDKDQIDGLECLCTNLNTNKGKYILPDGVFVGREILIKEPKEQTFEAMQPMLLDTLPKVVRKYFSNKENNSIKFIDDKKK